MPELPEVEHAASRAREAAVGRAIVRFRLLHPSYRRSLSPRVARQLAGETIAGVERRGKYQFLRLTSGRTLVVHFRMTGDWEVHPAKDRVPSHARAAIDLDDGMSLMLVDSRALGTIKLLEATDDHGLSLGPEATDAAFDAAWLGARVRNRRGPIKPVLLDQSVVAGIGNIYAGEALWYARLDPRVRASSLGMPQLRALVRGVKRALGRALAHPERYYSGAGGASRFNVYDREGARCRRCRGTIRRVVQAGRSTYYCAACQRMAVRPSSQKRTRSRK